MIDNSIDQALFDAAMSFVNPPALVRPYFDDSLEANKLIRKIEAQAEKNHKELQSFVLNGEKLRVMLKAAFTDHQVEEHHLENLDRIIITIEKRADKLSSDLAPLLKSIKQTFSAIGGFLPKHKAEFDRIYKVVKAQSQTEINELSDAALFLRALKAEHSPSSRGGKEFSDSKDLEAYLTSLLS